MCENIHHLPCIVPLDLTHQSDNSAKIIMPEHYNVCVSTICSSISYMLFPQVVNFDVAHFVTNDP